MVNVVMLGPPGVGKGTQAERLARERGILKISTGDILREAVQAETDLGRIAKATMAAGQLVSDETMIGIVKERLGRADAQCGFVLDGFPRTVAQAAALDELLAGRDPLVILEINVPPEELVRRVSARRICHVCGATAPDGEGTRCPRCGGALVQRNDDGPEIARERLNVYARDTRPLVDYYRPRPTFRSIDGNRSPDEVAAAVRAAIDSAIQPVRNARPAAQTPERSL